MINKPNIIKLTYCLIISVVIGVYYVMVGILAPSGPIYDDYAMINFVTNFTTSDSFIDKIAFLFERHNEHFLVTTKLLYLIYFGIFSSINFSALCFIGNMAIIGIYIVLLINLGRHKFTYLSLLLAFCIFQFSAAESMLWAMASISNYYMLLFCLLSLHYLFKNTEKSFYISFTFSIFAALTQGNGLIIIIVNALYLLTQKRHKESLKLLAIFLVFILLSILTNNGENTFINTSSIFDEAINITLYSFAFIGGALGIGSNTYPTVSFAFLFPSVFFGAFIFLLTGLFFYLKKFNNIFIWINLFVIITAFATALYRVDLGIAHALVSKYKIYSVIIIISTIILVIQHPIVGRDAIPVNKIIAYLYIPIIIYYIMSYTILSFYYFEKYGPGRNGEIIYSDKEIGQNILDEASINGIEIQLPTRVSEQ